MGLFVVFEVRRLSNKTGVVFFHLLAGTNDNHPRTVGMRRIETHLVAYPLGPLTASVSSFPPYIHAEGIAAICPEHCRTIPERIIVHVVFEDRIIVAPAVTYSFRQPLAANANQL